MESRTRFKAGRLRRWHQAVGFRSISGYRGYCWGFICPRVGIINPESLHRLTRLRLWFVLPWCMRHLRFVPSRWGADHQLRQELVYR